MQSVGNILQAMRIRRGKTLDEVATRTRIPKRIITALENDDHQALPAPVYVKGFIRSLCRELGYDGNELVLMFESARLAGPVEPSAPSPLLVLKSEAPKQDAAGPKGLRMAHALVLLVAALTFLGAILTAAMREDPEAANARPAAIRTGAPLPTRPAIANERTRRPTAPDASVAPRRAAAGDSTASSDGVGSTGNAAAAGGSGGGSAPPPIVNGEPPSN